MNMHQEWYPTQSVLRLIVTMNISLRVMLMAAPVFVSIVVASPFCSSAEDKLLDRLSDTHGKLSEGWVYNDIAQATHAARRQNKPLFVVFRCVPCHACAAFDADVASGNEEVRKLAKEKFVSVRQVEMKGVDLSLYQFDHDLNWAAMFVNADGVVYARYGTQSAEGPDAYNSIEGLLATMNRVLELHEHYPENATDLAGKRGKPKPFATALEMPGLQNPAKFAKQTTRQNCIHCHNIHDAEQADAKAKGTFTFDILWRYPIPDQVGMKIDRINGVRIKTIVAHSPAEEAGLRAGEEVLQINGQSIASIADMQWALHQVPNDDAEVVVVGSESGPTTLKLPAGWKKHDFSWRGSMWSLEPQLNVWMPLLSDDRLVELGIPKGDNALHVKWINRKADGGRAAFESGLRVGDVIVKLAGEPIRVTSRQIIMHIKLNYEAGDEVPVTLLRDGKPRELRIRLAE